ncbi:MAG: tetratricopeptide repeat protein [Verrucomicrobia bacterium]|nr:tetratricopeptide repeat protein [Verrucomicrobiota bacterium]
MSERKLYKTLQIAFTAATLTCVVIAGMLYANGTTVFKKRHAAWGLLRSQDYAAAVKALEDCVGRRPRSSSCWEGLAIARFHAGDFKGAAEALRTCWALRHEADMPGTASHLVYLRALEHDEIPGSALPGLFTIHSPGEPPKEYRDAGRNLRPGKYAEAAASFEACLGRMPGTPGEADALWGLAVARFFMDDYTGALEAIERIRVGSDKAPSKEFEAVVAYISARAEGRSPSEPMPPVLRHHVPRGRK